MNRGELISTAKILMGERGSFWSTSDLNTLANLANREVYTYVSQYAPWSLASQSQITYPANSESISLSSVSYFGLGVLKVLSVRWKPLDGIVSPSNPAVELAQIAEGDWQGGVPVPTLPGLSWPTVRPRHWKVYQDKLFLVPTPTVAQYLDIFWIPQLQALGSDAAGLLNGIATPFHDFVLKAMTCFMDAKQAGSSNPALLAVWAQLENLAGRLATGQQPPVMTVYDQYA